MLPRDRIDYSSPFHRPPLSAPEGTRLIVWPVVNIEEWDIQRPMPRQVSPAPGGQKNVPDVPNWTWHEYGMRVGFWRLLEAFKSRDIRPTLSLNAKVCETVPEVPQAAKDAGWEFMAHCYEQMSIHAVPDQAAMIRQSADILEEFTGIRPRGWLGPGRTQTFETLDLVAAAGYDWFGDWILDDQPLWVRTETKPLISVPYSVELNDITIMVSAQHRSDVMLDRVRDAAAVLHAESADSVRVMAFGVHPYVSGAAHRISYFERMLDHLMQFDGVAFWTGGEISDWFAGEVPRP
jgi:peptidoglycan/xylan/chitin deacetylase (PgdA/CDA1 family)